MQNKRKTILTLLLACISIGSNADTPTMQHLMELPPFERAVLIIKYYETLHRPEHWPTIGYGHVVQPGESYCKGLQLTESLLLACLSYNCGPAKVLGGKGYMKSRLLQRIEAGDRNILTDYLSFCHYKGKIHYGIYRRRWVEYQLLYSDNDKPVLK